MPVWFYFRQYESCSVSMLSNRKNIELHDLYTMYKIIWTMGQYLFKCWLFTGNRSWNFNFIECRIIIAVIKCLSKSNTHNTISRKKYSIDLQRKKYPARFHIFPVQWHIILIFHDTWSALCLLDNFYTTNAMFKDYQ